MKKGVRSILSLPPETTQEEMQKELDRIYQQHNIETVMEALFQWELKTGYITKEKMKSNPLMKFRDKEYNIQFRLQVNVARTKYSEGKIKPKNKNIHCVICPENIGEPGKEHLRLFRLEPGRMNRNFFLFAALFPYFPNHFILTLIDKKPQKINENTLQDLFEFVDMAPSYTCCSNSDLAWTGVSVPEHLHYQDFKKLHLPVMEAKEIEEFASVREDVRIAPLHYPCGVLRLRSRDRASIMNRMALIINKWKKIKPDKQSVNLIIQRIPEEVYCAVIFLRNSDFRTPEELKHIKSEGIGVIEMAGEAILPEPKEKNLGKYIKKEGLNIIKEIIKGNNPVRDRGFWKEFL